MSTDRLDLEGVENLRKAMDCTVRDLKQHSKQVLAEIDDIEAAQAQDDENAAMIRRLLHQRNSDRLRPLDEEADQLAYIISPAPASADPDGTEAVTPTLDTFQVPDDDDPLVTQYYELDELRDMSDKDLLGLAAWYAQYYEEKPPGIPSRPLLVKFVHAFQERFRKEEQEDMHTTTTVETPKGLFTVQQLLAMNDDQVRAIGKDYGVVGWNTAPRMIVIRRIVESQRDYCITFKVDDPNKGIELPKDKSTTVITRVRETKVDDLKHKKGCSPLILAIFFAIVGAIVGNIIWTHPIRDWASGDNDLVHNGFVQFLVVILVAAIFGIAAWMFFNKDDE